MLTKKVPKSSDKYVCDCCNYESVRKSQFNRHIMTAKHISLTQLTEKVPKSSDKYTCEICRYETARKSQYKRHLETTKHKALSKSDEKVLNSSEKFQKSSEIYTCEYCQKQYTSRAGIWKHKQVCVNEGNVQHTTNQLTMTNIISADIVLHLLQQNRDFKDLLIEQQNENQKQQLENQRLHKESQRLQGQLIDAVKETGNVYNNNNTTNNNQKFNLNFFLNNTCKDAMNMSEFIEDMEVQFADIENIGRDGYVTGMTNMIMSRIKNLDVTKRPLHCTDLKRETIYIKDNNVWEKDDDNKKLHNMIQCIAHKNYAILPAWRDKNPDCLDSDTPKFDFCIKMMTNVLGDAGEGQIKLDNKVIRNIAKRINVDKNTYITEK